MKKSTLICCFSAFVVLVALFSSPLTSLVAESNPFPYAEDPWLKRHRLMPPEVFESEETLRKWAADSAEWQGEIRQFRGNDTQQVIVALRSFTTALESSEAAVYLRDAAGSWRLVLHRQPILRDVIVVIREADRLVLSTRNEGKTLIEIPFDGLEPVISRSALREVDVLTHFSPVPTDPNE